MPQTSSLEQQLAKVPIEIPKSPFWDVFTRFGRDELLACIINVTGTAGAEHLLTGPLSGFLSEHGKNIFLSATGPIIEKVGFFPGNLRDAYKEYRATPIAERDPLSTYIKRGFAAGGKSLLEDILIHDPLYIGLMYVGLQKYPETPAWMVAGASFMAAVVAVAGLEVGANEALYARYKKALCRVGFEIETYYESRFVIGAAMKPEQALHQLASHFSLPARQVGHYHDRYVRTTLPHYSGRIPQVRLRRRVMEKNKEVQSAQIIYRRASEIKHKDPDQFRYFPQKKEKIYFPLHQQMPQTIAEIGSLDVRRMLGRATISDAYKDITFTRSLAYDPATLLASVDQVHEDQPFYVLELKVRRDTNLLKAAMRLVMRDFPVVQTTHGKYELVNGEA